jgi:hypothetical protein
MVLQYPKVFDVEGKPGDIDRGDAKSQHKWLRDLAKNPKAVVNAYFTSEEQVQFLMDFVGFDNEVTNPKTGETSTRIKDGNSDLGTGKYIQLTRRMDDTREYIDKNGNPQEMNKGGLPTVKILTAEGDKFVEYDYDTLGSPANGTEAKVRFEPRYMRLDAIGITKLIEYVEGEYEEDGF